MSMLAELVDVVIGVDTHKHTHTAALVAAAHRRGARRRSPWRPTPTATRSWWRWPSQHPAGCGRGRSRAPAATAPAWPATSHAPRGVGRRARPPGPPGAPRTARSPMRSTPSRRPRRPGPRQLAAPKTGPRAGRAGGADGRAALRGRRRHRRPTPTPRPRRHRPRDPPGPVPRPVHHRDGRHRSRACARHARGDIEVSTALSVLRDPGPPHPGHAHRGRRPRTGHHWPSSGPGAPTCSTSPGSARSSPRPCCPPGHTPAVSAHDAAFAMLAGAAPIPASSGKTIRHRLNRSGDRQLNRALHIIAWPGSPRPRHPRLHRPPTSPRQNRPRHPPLPQALHRPPALPPARNRPPHGLTTP